jgi:cyclophilin family peptidyl-prolyl cis-trans isomerase
MPRILLFLLLVCAPSRYAFSQATEAPPAGAAAPAAGEQPAVEPAADAPAAGAEAAAAPQASAEAVAANEAFEKLVDQWNTLIAKLKELQQQRDAAAGDARAALEKQMADVRTQTSTLVEKIGEAGLAAYKSDPLAFPRVNVTLLAIAQFQVIGDPHGDGGDQYEKALPLVKGFIDAGGGDKWPQLYLLGGAAAYNTNDFALAEEYLKKAATAGMFANLPQRTENEAPGVKLLFDAKDDLDLLPTQRKHWEEEQAIRAAEAKADDLPRVKLTTSKGDIVLELFENEAPQAVANFLTLVKAGFYNGVTFHRVLPLFMAQGGDPKGTGNGGPGYNIRDEYKAPKARRHFRGSLAMARTDRPNSSGSQFYLTFVPTTMLDGGYTVFGRVLEGVDVAAALRRRDPSGPGPKPTPDKILKAEVLRDRGHEYKFEKLPE